MINTDYPDFLARLGLHDDYWKRDIQSVSRNLMRIESVSTSGVSSGRCGDGHCHNLVHAIMLNSTFRSVKLSLQGVFKSFHVEILQSE